MGCLAEVLECCVSSCGPISSLDPWDGWIPPDLHGFFRWVFDALALVNDFTGQVIGSRKDAGVREWTNWLREDLGSRPYALLRPDLVHPSSFLFIKDPETQSSRILVEGHLTDAEFRKAWMFFSVGLDIQLLQWTCFRVFVGHLLPRRPILSFRGSRGASCKKLRGLKSLPLVGWMVGPGMRLKLSLFPGSLGWLSSWIWLSPLRFGLKGNLMPFLP